MGLVHRARAKRILAFPSIFATAAQMGQGSTARG